MAALAHTIRVEWGVTGLAAALFYRVVDANNTALVARSQAGIVEFPAGSGIYCVIGVVWDDDLDATVLWDDNSGGPDAFATETMRRGVASIASAVDDLAPGTTQPRVNFPPDPGFTTKVDNRSSGLHKCVTPIVITPGVIDKIYVAIDLSPLFGFDNFVKTVGTPVASNPGSITAAAEGPRDWFAFVRLDGTALANQVMTVTVPLTMQTETEVDVAFDVKVTAI